MFEWFETVLSPFLALPAETIFAVYLVMIVFFLSIFFLIFAFGAGFKCSFVLLKRLIAKIRKRG